MEPETIGAPALPGYWPVLAAVAMIVILLLIPLIGFLVGRRRDGSQDGEDKS